MDVSMPMHDERNLGSLRFREIDLPQIREWQVGGQYYLVVKVEQTSIENNGMNTMMEGPDSSKYEANFKVLSVRALDKKPISVKELEQKEFSEIYAKAMSGEI